MKILKIKYFILLFFPAYLFTQVNTYSPYSFFGVGDLAPSGFTEQLSVGGLGNSFFDMYQLNFSNPSSYSFLEFSSIELGGGISFNRMNQGDLKQNNIISNITGLGLGFPVSKNASIVSLSEKCEGN